MSFFSGEIEEVKKKINDLNLQLTSQLPQKERIIIQQQILATQNTLAELFKFNASSGKPEIKLSNIKIDSFEK